MPASAFSVLRQHVKGYQTCPNPLCDIRSSHDYLFPHPPRPALKGVPHLTIKRFQKNNPFPNINCWKVIAPVDFNPEGEPLVYLPEGFGTVWIQDMCEEERGWRLFEARTNEDGLIALLAFRKRRTTWWKRW